jgi:hypothetical protein
VLGDHRIHQADKGFLVGAGELLGDSESFERGD